MNSANRTLTARVLLGAALTLALVAPVGLSAPTQAAAATRAKKITRSRVMDRSKTWIKRRVSYSQNRTYNGYRRDCSGFVSMAWMLGESYTTRSLDQVSSRIKRSKARPGDAVLYPGHVVIFGGWKSKKAGTYYAYEQTTWGSHAKRRVRSIRGGAVLRRDGIKKTAKVAKMTVTRVASTPTTASAPAPEPSLSLAIPSTDDGGSTATAMSAVMVYASVLH